MSKTGRIILIFIALITLVTAIAEAQTRGITLMSHTATAEGTKPEQRLYLEGYSQVKGRVGAWTFGGIQEDYRFVLAGPSLDLFSVGEATVSVGAGAGAEFFPNDNGKYGAHKRYAGYISAAGEKFEALLYYENGESKEKWVLGNALWNVNSALSLGVLHQTGDGTGPQLAVSIPKTPIRIWAAPMFGEGKRLLLGAEIGFEK